jgi:hypothetical protein
LVKIDVHDPHRKQIGGPDHPRHQRFSMTKTAFGFLSDQFTCERQRNFKLRRQETTQTRDEPRSLRQGIGWGDLRCVDPSNPGSERKRQTLSRLHFCA